MEFSPFDKRGYPTVAARIGYRECAARYEANGRRRVGRAAAG
jgi:hypothetical protein